MRHPLFALTAATTITAALVLAPRVGTAEVREPFPIPNSLIRFFMVPPQYHADFGKYETQLTRNNDARGRDSERWAVRKAEILRYWHDRMGPWPPLLEKPALEIQETKRRDNFTQHKIRLQVAADRHNDAYLQVPDGKGPFPAVLVVYYDPETGAGLGKELRDFGYQLARRGFVTLSVGSPYQSNYPAPGKPVLQPLSYLAYLAANCHTALAQRPEVDPQRIGIVGHSYGGKWAMFASCLYDKFAAAAWSDGGIVFDETRPNVNYWDPWYLGYEPGGDLKKRPLPSATSPRTGAYRRLVAEKHDLHELHALMVPRPFFVSGGAEDQPERWRALNPTIHAYEKLGFGFRVGMSNRPTHDPTPESNEQIYQFFTWALKK